MSYEMVMQTFAYERITGGVRIWRCFSVDDRVQIPEQIDGQTVLELAPYAFSDHMDSAELKKGLTAVTIVLEGHGMAKPLVEAVEDQVLSGNRLRRIELPVTLEKIGRYCFYNCENLVSLKFFGTIKDWGTGAFTGCHQVTHLEIWTAAGEDSSMKEVLSELHEELSVDYHSEEGHARLVFPEYFEEGVENTPARILETHVHGSGLYYRNCFQQGAFDLNEYDSRFSYARAQERSELVGEMAMGRLLFPWRLKEAARIQYETYIRKHTCEMVDVLLKKRELAYLRWLVGSFQKEPLQNGHTEEMQSIIEKASRAGYVEALSYLMAFYHRYRLKKMKKPDFEL